MLNMWMAPNLLVFGHGETPPVPGQQKPSDPLGLDVEAEDEDTKKDPQDEASPEGQGTKGNVRGFSSKSSLNISRLLSSIDWKKNGMCVHITLTYHLAWPSTKHEIKLAKQALVQSLGRKLVCGIWKLEYQNRETLEERDARRARRISRTKARGSLLVPHWHVLGWIPASRYEEFCEWLFDWWSGYSGNDSTYAIDVRPGDTGKASFYLCLHAAKTNQTPAIEVGRWWGYIHRDKVMESVDVALVGQINRLESIWWYRLYRRYRRMPAKPMQVEGHGWSWFLPRDAQMRAAIWVRDTVTNHIRSREDPF